ncbi:nuclear transport factor 2 family protein [Ensifer sp. ENS12]|uniref:nuclear transport factor 2 family protein n=1 Tax=Ensifer sp. ENS12 TaxID=2854774 RepID=UPI000DD9576D|nr:nuclear transport factor 2 family protein [Ensifer sp. ENS12]MBV7522558.1 nuclear transport factor 2 family protein [Ensifer sp. ENS12]
MTATSTIQTFLNHIFAGTMHQALVMIHPEARFISTSPVSNPANPLHGTFIGVEGAKQFFGGFADLLEPGDFNVTASFGDAEHAAFYGTLRHKVRKTSKEFASDWALICRLRDDRITLYHFYEDTEALLYAMQ